MKKKLSSLLIIFIAMTFSFSNINITDAKATGGITESLTESLTEGELDLENKSLDYNLIYGSNNTEDKENTPNFATFESAPNLTESTINPIVVLIDFPESDTDTNKGKLIVNKTYPENTLNTIENAFNGESYSLRDYTSKVSRGKCIVNSYLPYKENGTTYVYTAEKTKEYYMPYNSSTNPKGYTNMTTCTKLLADAFASIKDKIPADLNLDVNKDGYLDAVDFFVPYQTDWSTFLWPHKWSISSFYADVTKVNGAKLNTYNIITTDYFRSSRFHVVTHEFFHTLGFPDMYTYTSLSANKSPVDKWSMMASNTGYPTVWERIKYGKWVSDSNIPTISLPSTYTLKGSTLDPKENTIAYKITVPNSNEFFMVEYRDKTSNIYEAEVPGTGMIVYRVNPYIKGNSGQYPELEILKPENVYYTNSSYLDGGTNRKSINLNLSNGTYSGYTINYVSHKGDTASFKLEKKAESLKINTFTSDSSEHYVGKSASYTVDATPNSSDLRYSYYVNDKLIVENSLSNKFSYTPEKAGNQTVKVVATDGSATDTKTLTVQVKEDNKTVIYYNGYSNPYIHYKTTNGTWTQAPGVLMTPSTDVSGYTHKIEIPLGSDTGITACFNNGSGSWDSNNGNNYNFSDGYYTFASGKITKIEKPIKTIIIDSLTASVNSPVIEGTSVVFKATATNNIGEVQYKFDYKNNTTGESGTFRGFTTYNTLSWITKAGNYTITVTAKDSTSTATKSINYEVLEYKDLKITSINSSLGDNFTLNKTTNLTVNTEGGSGNNKYTIYVNGVAITTNSSSPFVAWTPNKSGLYTIKAEVVSGNSIVTLEKTINVEDVKSNITTIYYKGYDTPYIHYKIGSGAWTVAPGIKMTATDELSGYTHKAEIDLSTETILTACFNNGSNSWDNNNGNNYNFSDGYYTISGGKITKIEKPTKTLTINSLTASNTSPLEIGYATTFTADVTGNTGDISYQFEYKKLGDLVFTMGKAYSLTKSFSWSPESTGDYIIRVTAKDSKTTVQKEIPFKIKDKEPLKITSITSSAGDTIKTGTKTTLTVNTTGGDIFKVTTVTINGYEYLSNSTNNKLEWTPSKAGTYYIRATVSSGNAVETFDKIITVEDVTSNITTIYYKGYDNPYIHYRIGNGAWTVAPGIKMTATNEVAGYTYKAEIDLGTATILTACFNNGSGSWDSNNGNNYNFGSGYYTISNGTITKIEKPSKTLVIDSLTASVNSPVVSGTQIVFKATTSNNTGDVQYKFDYKNNTTGESGTFRDFSSYNTLSWATGKEGNYTITVTAKDTISTVTKSINYTVEAYKSLNITTIYYKGYDNPYIHYRIGNGEWTVAPGIKMIATNELSGYSHKAEIDLGTATILTTCFNNGSGSWDSNNGNNYSFSVGSYTYTNGKITKIN